MFTYHYLFTLVQKSADGSGQLHLHLHLHLHLQRNKQGRSKRNIYNILTRVIQWMLQFPRRIEDSELSHFLVVYVNFCPDVFLPGVL